MECHHRSGCAHPAKPPPRPALPPQVAVVLGSQWGDEGKGKLVDILAQQYDVIARAQVKAALWGRPPASPPRPQRCAAPPAAPAHPHSPRPASPAGRRQRRAHHL